MPKCICGNNKTPSACCLLKVSSKPWSGVPKKVTIKHALADAERLAQQGQWRQCVLICDAAQHKVPGHPKAIYLKALHAMSSGNIPKAVSLFASIYNTQQDKLSYVLNYVNALHQFGDRMAVSELIANQESVLSKDSRGLKLSIDVFSQYDHVENVIKYAQLLVHVEPQVVEHRLTLVNAFHRKLDDTNALQTLETALEVFPCHPELVFTKASILEVLNHNNDAMAIVSQLCEQKSPHTHWLILASKLSRKLNRLPEAYAYLDKAKEGLPKERIEVQRAYLTEQGALARIDEDYEFAFDTALQIRKQRQQATQKEWELLEQQRKLMGKSQYLPYDAEPDDLGKSPHLYIVGFPRCGSTLLERLCCSYYNGVSYSESNLIPNLISSLSESKGDAWWTLTKAQWEQVGQVGREQPELYTQGTPSVDKNLFNISRVPFIRQFDSKAIIVRCLRDPLAIVMSNFFANFMQYEPWQYSIESISRYLAHIDAVWGSTVNVSDSRVISVKYEDVVKCKAPTPELEKCLANYWLAEKTKNSDIASRAAAFRSRTASYEQVTKSIATSANDEYKHYISMIPESAKVHIAALQAKWGYDVSV